MPRKKNNQNNLSKFIDKKIPIEDLSMKTMKVTIHALRWIFLMIFIFITIGIFALLITGGQTYIQQIIGFGITGFFTFFMGYFGWILAQGIIEMIVGKEEKDEHAFSFYVRKKNRYKF